MKYLVYGVWVLSLLLISPTVARAQSSCSGGGSQDPMDLTVANFTGQTLSVYWLNFSCTEQHIQDVPHGGAYYDSTYDGHEWIFRDSNGQEVSRFAASVNAPFVALGLTYTPEALTTNCSSAGVNQEVNFNIINRSNEPVLLFWVNYDCSELFYGTLRPAERWAQPSFVGHEWVVRYADGRVAQHVTVAASTPNVVIAAPNPPIVVASNSGGSTASPTAVPSTPSTPETGTSLEGFPVTESGCVVSPVTADLGVDAFYTKYCTYEGLRILASDNVEDAALKQAWLIAANMFFNRADVVASLVTDGFFVALMGEEEQILDIPELQYLAENADFNPEGVRDFSKVLELPRLILGAEENLLCYATDAYYGENRLVGHLANITRYALIRGGVAPEVGDLVNATREAAIANGLWANSAWITESNGNYWDYGVKTYFNSSYDGLTTGPTDNYTNTRVELAEYDPELLAVIDSVYQLPDWTPPCPSLEEVIVEPTEAVVEAETLEPAPTEVAGDSAAVTFPVTESGCVVSPVTADMGVDAFYAKYCDYEGLPILASANVEDAALEQAWLIAANMFFNRADVVASLVTDGFFVALMGEEDQILDVPELKYLGDNPDFNVNIREFSKVLELPRLVLGAEENLLCYDSDVHYGENWLVGHLANITRYALIRGGVAPEVGDLVNVTREAAIANGLWANSAWITESNGNYWDYGVKTYFNSSYAGLTTGPTDNYTNTRVELAEYDPELLALIDSVYQLPDWTPVCP